MCYRSMESSGQCDSTVHIWDDRAVSYKISRYCIVQYRDTSWWVNWRMYSVCTQPLLAPHLNESLTLLPGKDVYWTPELSCIVVSNVIDNWLRDKINISRIKIFTCNATTPKLLPGCCHTSATQQPHQSGHLGDHCLIWCIESAAINQQKPKELNIFEADTWQRQRLESNATMKFSTVSSLVASALYVTAVSAFVQLPPAATRTPHLYATTSVELVAEPDGGVELKKVSDASLPGSRMKNMVGTSLSFISFDNFATIKAIHTIFSNIGSTLKGCSRGFRRRRAFVLVIGCCWWAED